ncbi:MAG: hypothetical protein LUI01_02220 [Firmicutes bacterium]|nr:hypothetical protein [Bacillota bacterium]
MKNTKKGLTALILVLALTLTFALSCADSADSETNANVDASVTGTKAEKQSTETTAEETATVKTVADETVETMKITHIGETEIYTDYDGDLFDPDNVISVGLFSEIYFGMTDSELFEVLGQPSGAVGSGYIYWIYYVSDGRLCVFNSNPYDVLLGIGVYTDEYSHVYYRFDEETNTVCRSTYDENGLKVKEETIPEADEKTTLEYILAAEGEDTGYVARDINEVTPTYGEIEVSEPYGFDYTVSVHNILKHFELSFSTSKYTVTADTYGSFGGSFYEWSKNGDEVVYTDIGTSYELTSESCDNVYWKLPDNISSLWDMSYVGEVGSIVVTAYEDGHITQALLIKIYFDCENPITYEYIGETYYFYAKAETYVTFHKLSSRIYQSVTEDYIKELFETE